MLLFVPFLDPFSFKAHLPFAFVVLYLHFAFSYICGATKGEKLGLYN